MAVFHRGCVKFPPLRQQAVDEEPRSKVRSGMTFCTANCGRQTVESPGPTCQTASGPCPRALRSGHGPFLVWGAWDGREEWRKGEARQRRLAASVRPGFFAAPGEGTYIHTYSRD